MTLKTWLKIVIWSLVLTLTVVVLYLSESVERNQLIGSPEISIRYHGEDVILTEQELLYRLKNNSLYAENQKAEELDFRKIEEAIQKMSEVKECNVFKQYGGKWGIDMELRHPIARIIDRNKNHYFLDKEGFLMKSKPNIVCRVPLITGKIPMIKEENFVSEIINKDSLISNRILQDIYTFSVYVCDNPFLSSLITQIDVDERGSFDLIPLIGDYIIKVGKVESDASLKDKMLRLENFYKKGIPFEGWNKYSEINLSYDGQIVCKKRS